MVVGSSRNASGLISHINARILLLIRILNEEEIPHVQGIIRLLAPPTAAGAKGDVLIAMS